MKREEFRLPHIVINGKIEVKQIFKSIKPLFDKSENGIIKTSEFFISKDKNTILIKALSIEKDNKVSFLILINNREDGIVIRLYPDLNVPKTIGVKKSLVEVAKQILKENENLNVGKTNLIEYL